MNAKTKIANCNVLPSEADGSEGYVRTMTPLDTKRAEIADRELTNADENQVRVRETARRRKKDSVRPL
jgi:hypothetical protein